MNNINLIFPDKSVHSFASGISGEEVVQSIGPGLARVALAFKVDEELYDLQSNIDRDGTFQVITGDSPEGHEILLHSAAHLMAQAVKQLFPEAKVTIGPAIENRFYYDFDIDSTFTAQDLVKIENQMKALAKSDFPVYRKLMSRSEALNFFNSIDEAYKVEIIEEIDQDEVLSAYTQGDFTDLCRGPHVPSTGKLKYFKLLDSSGAYWRGDENNKMLQRIYGTAFYSKKELNLYLHNLEEAKKRDHRKLGKELHLFTFDDEVGPGLPLWLPNGTVLIDELEALAKETETKAGYNRVKTPHITKGSLYEKSGHLEHYKTSMYPAMDVDGTEYYLKPMNCPHHHKIFDSQQRSYRDMPVRLAEYGTCYRYEKSGQLFGLMRVRSMQMNDAHIYCTAEQFKSEFLDVCKMYLEYFKIFDIQKYVMRLSLHDPKALGRKYVDEPELWLETESAVRDALVAGGINFVEIPGEAAFYGPKIDVQVWSAIGREFTLATNQVDFAIPARFKLHYIDEHGESKTPLCIHRAPLGTHERFIGFLIEHFGGDFPLWLAPIQVSVLPISEKYNTYGELVRDRLKENGIRTILDARPDKIGAKIRKSELSKINVMLIVGEREALDETVSVRRRFDNKNETLILSDLIVSLKSEIKQRRLPYRKIR